MDDKMIIKNFLDENNINYFENINLSEYTSFKIGGVTPFLIDVKSEIEIVNLIKFFVGNNIKYFVLGKGSNLLISDKGLNYPIIKIGQNFSDIKIQKNIITAYSGASLSVFCKACCENNLSGAEFAYGIPGTVGGAIYMNAGAYDGEIRDIISSVRAVDKKGNIIQFSKEKMNLSYRKSIFQNDEYIILSAKFLLTPLDKTKIKEKMDGFLTRRKDKQPLEYPSAGSTFKRPEGAFAGTLIEQCGLKGYCVGGAMVSQKHAGFVINFNKATSNDVLKLICDVKKTVAEKTGYVLEPEVKMIGEF